MTKNELKEIFNDARVEVYSSESRAKIEEQIKRGDSDIDGLVLALVTNREMDKAFLFRVLEKALCDK